MMAYVAIWGAVLSTVLAAIRVWEFWQNRFRLEIDPFLTSLEEVGNEIQIRNLSDTPLLITYWELVWLSGYWPLRKCSRTKSAEPDMSDIRIDAYSSTKFTFKEENHFGWGAKALKGRRIYLKLTVAGRGKVLRKVYG